MQTCTHINTNKAKTNFCSFFKNSKTLKAFQYLPIGDQVNKMWRVTIMEKNDAIQVNKLGPQGTLGKNLKINAEGWN